MAAMGNCKRQGDVDDISTWRKFEPWLCESCRANCCRLPIEVTIPDLVRMEIVSKTEAKTPIEKIGDRLKQGGLIEHLYVRERIFILAQTAGNVCRYLDPDSRTCRIYAKRPDTCREYPEIGPRPGFCAYERK
jgi:Fe-S-cluster containining protein